MIVVEQLQRTRDAFVRATQGLTEAQLRFRAGDVGWSIADIVEHIALADRGLLTVVTEKIREGAPPSPGKATDAGRFERLAARIPARAIRRLDAPLQLIPKQTWPTVEAALTAFVDARAALIAVAAAAGPDATARVVPHRLLGELDVEEWLYFAGLHAQRHADQIGEIRAAQGWTA